MAEADNTGRVLTSGAGREWFELPHLLESALADVISADANFQLTQTMAWRDFGNSLAEFTQLPAEERPELAAGFGRLENLGMTEVRLSLQLEVNQPGWLRRQIWRVRKWLKRPTPPPGHRYRLAPPGRGSSVRLDVVVSRDSQGRYTARHESDTP